MDNAGWRGKENYTAESPGFGEKRNFIYYKGMV